MEATLDLRPYGVNHVLTPQTYFGDFKPSIVSQGRLIYTDTDILFKIDGVEYRQRKLLGKGTYGTTYEVIHNDKQYALKIIRFDEKDFRTKFKFFVCEAIIQILLADVSKGQVHGPFVPKLYKIAYIPESHSGVIVSEMMRGTFDTLIRVNTPKDNELIVVDALLQIARVLEFFGKTLRFNHRDLKPDNIMYVRKDDTRYFKLIDFGFSCIHWHGLKIQGGDYFRTEQICYKSERDLAQLVYYIYMFFPQYITHTLDDFLHNFLHVRVGTSKCNMGKSCPRWHLHEWKNTYDFLNRKNVHSPATRPNVFMQELQRFKNGKPFKGYIEDMQNATRKTHKPVSKAPKTCPEGKILNPKTRRCVKKPVSKTRKTCPEGKILNPKTGRCGKKPVSKTRKTCPEGKVINPKTGRCGKKPASTHQKTCPEGKVLNPNTGRCVKTRKMRKALFSLAAL